MKQMYLIAIQINPSDICFVFCLLFLILQLSPLIAVILHLWPVMLLVSAAQFLHHGLQCQTSGPKDQSHRTKSHPVLFSPAQSTVPGSTRSDTCLRETSSTFSSPVAFKYPTYIHNNCTLRLLTCFYKPNKTDYGRNRIYCHVFVFNCHFCRMLS